MPDRQIAVHEPPPGGSEQWLEDPIEELPPRPRRRLLAPVPLALAGVLLIACGFIAGVLIEKGQTSSGSPGAGGAAGLASRFAALRGASGTGFGTSAGASAAGGSASTVGGGGGGRGGATIGQVAYVEGHTLYVTDAEGNTLEVKTSPASTVTKTVKADVKGIRPGETVIVTGTSGSSGAIDAESIRVGGETGGLGALFGARGAGTRGDSRGGGGTEAGGSSGGGDPALFGKGG